MCPFLLEVQRALESRCTPRRRTRRSERGSVPKTPQRAILESNTIGGVKRFNVPPYRPVPGARGAVSMHEQAASDATDAAAAAEAGGSEPVVDSNMVRQLSMSRSQRLSSQQSASQCRRLPQAEGEGPASSSSAVSAPDATAQARSMARPNRQEQLASNQIEKLCSVDMRGV